MATEVPREKLKELIEKNGDSLFQDRDRCEGLLKDYCGGYRREISAIVGALEERIPVELKSSWQTAMTPEAMRARLVQRLEDNRGLAPEIANYAVDTWSYALGCRSGPQLRSGAGCARGRAKWFRTGRVGGRKSGGGSERRLTLGRRRGGAAGSGEDRRFHRRSQQSEQGHHGGAGLVAAVAIAFAVLHHPQPAPPPMCPACAERPEWTEYAARARWTERSKHPTRAGWTKWPKHSDGPERGSGQTRLRPERTTANGQRVAMTQGNASSNPQTKSSA